MIKQLASTVATSLLAVALFLPVISGGTLVARDVVTGCIQPDWGCTQDGEQVTTFEDGSGTLNGLSVCFLPRLGCSANPHQTVTFFEDGSVRISIAQ